MQIKCRTFFSVIKNKYGGYTIDWKDPYAVRLKFFILRLLYCISNLFYKM